MKKLPVVFTVTVFVLSAVSPAWTLEAVVLPMHKEIAVQAPIQDNIPALSGFGPRPLTENRLGWVCAPVDMDELIEMRTEPSKWA